MPKYKAPRMKVTFIRNGRVRRISRSLNRSTAKNPAPSDILGARESLVEIGSREEVVQPEEHIPTTSNHKVQDRDIWETVKKELRKAFYEASCPEEGPCIVCNRIPTRLVTCRECSRTGHVFCHECAVKMHREHCLLHTLVEWQNDHPFALGFQCTFAWANHDCASMYTRAIRVFNDKGHLHSSFATFCMCEPPAATLVRYGLWPCSAQMPTTAVSMNLMDLIYCMMMEGQVSLKANCQAVGNHCSLTDSEVNLLYRCIVGECMEQFRFFRYNVRNLGDMPQNWNPMQCPACPKEGSIFISLDANFGLVRKQSSGKSNHEPNHGANLFVPDDEVQGFVEGYDRSVTPHEDDKSCSNFQAGSAIRTKNQSKKLDTTGVFGSACRHGIPQVFLDMKHGERLAYPALAIQKILESLPSDSSCQVHILYDIACKLHAHLQKRGGAGDDILKKIKMAVPIFHAYGHKRSCQISYGTKWSAGFGLTDGEVMERIWAFLRKFAHITKEMTPSHRVDLLTDALYYFAQKKIDSVDIHLKTKMVNARKVESEASAELTSLLQQCQGSIADVESWWETEKRSVSENDRTQDTCLSWDEKYVKELIEYDALRNQLHLCSDPQRVSILNKNCERIQCNLTKTERSKQIQARWQAEDTLYINAKERLQTKEKKNLLAIIHRKSCEHSFIVSCARRYSAGQTLATRLTKQVKASGATLRRLVKAYNDKAFTSGDLPNSIAFQEVLNLESQIYTSIQRSALTAVKRNSIDLFNKQARAREEQLLLVDEMKQFLSTRKQQHIALSHYLSTLGNIVEMSKEQKGMKHLISIKLMLIEGQYQRAAAAFGEYIDDLEHLSGTYHDYCTNVDFFPSHSEEVDTSDIVYSDSHHDVDEGDVEDIEDEDDEDEEDHNDQPLI